MSTVLVSEDFCCLPSRGEVKYKYDKLVKTLNMGETENKQPPKLPVSKNSPLRRGLFRLSGRLGNGKRGK